LGYFGFPHEEIARFARALCGRGLFRIVPIGEALQFGAVWDGIGPDA
jgi:hypothetical protein